MGKRGPKRTPTKVLARRGSWRARAREKAGGEPRPESGRPTCPQWLTGEGRRAWHRLVRQLDAMGLLARCDQHALARYCRIWQQWVAEQAHVIEHGEVVDILNRDGAPVGEGPSIHLQNAQKHADQLLRLEQHFGLTPSARASLAGSVRPERKTADHDRQGPQLRVV